MPGVWWRQGVADLDAALEVCGVRAQDLGDCRDDLSPHAYAVEHVVCRDLAGYLAEKRGLGAEPARHGGAGSYETAWVWLHKLRRAMVRPDRELLAGVVEVDESFVGAAPPAGGAPRRRRCRS